MNKCLRLQNTIIYVMILIMDEIEKLKDENNNLKQKLDDLKQNKKR